MYLAPVPAVALACGRPETTIRSWILRYPHQLPNRGTSHDGYALYDIDDALTLNRQLKEARARGVPLATILAEETP